MSDWRRMSTAPRDGTKILLWRDAALWREAEIAVGYWGRFNAEEDRWLRVGGGLYPEDALPTHWMPLPEPPGAK